MPTEEPRHWEELPKRQQKMLDDTTDLVATLCPGCQLRFISYIAARAMNDIVAEQRMGYLKDIMKATLIVAQELAEADQAEKDATRH